MPPHRSSKEPAVGESATTAATSSETAAQSLSVQRHHHDHDIRDRSSHNNQEYVSSGRRFRSVCRSRPTSDRKNNPSSFISDDVISLGLGKSHSMAAMKNINGNQRKLKPPNTLARDGMPPTYNYDYDEGNHHSCLHSGAIYPTYEYPQDEGHNHSGRDNGLDHDGIYQAEDDIFDENDLGNNGNSWDAFRHEQAVQPPRHQNLPEDQEIIDLEGDSDSDYDYGGYQPFHDDEVNRFQTSGEFVGEKIEYDQRRRLTASKSPAFNRRSREFLYFGTDQRSSSPHQKTNESTPSTSLQQTSVLDAFGANRHRQESSSKGRRDSCLVPNPWSSQSTMANEPAGHLKRQEKDEKNMPNPENKGHKRRFRSQLAGVDVAGRRQLSQDIRSQRNDLNSYGDAHMLSRPENKSNDSMHDEDDIKDFDNDASRQYVQKSRRKNPSKATKKQKAGKTSRRRGGRGRGWSRGGSRDVTVGSGRNGNGFPSSYTSTTNEWQSTASAKPPNGFNDIGAEISF